MTVLIKIASSGLKEPRQIIWPLSFKIQTQRIFSVLCFQFLHFGQSSYYNQIHWYLLHRYTDIQVCTYYHVGKYKDMYASI